MRPYPVALPQPARLHRLTCIQSDDTKYDARHEPGVYRTNGHARTSRTPISASRHNFVDLELATILHCTTDLGSDLKSETRDGACRRCRRCEAGRTSIDAHR